jgi:hypothetical protein
MTHTALIIVNGFAALCLLSALALVMVAGHQVTRPESARPVEPELERGQTDLARAA